MGILSEIEFGNLDNILVPNFFVNVSDVSEKKIEVMQIYDMELEELAFLKSPEAARSLTVSRASMAVVRYVEIFKVAK